jgi:hypothetical protein
MIKNFEELKKQLGELVDIVNGFKSEQVQLRVVEAILANLGAPLPPPLPTGGEDPPTKIAVSTAGHRKSARKRKQSGSTANAPRTGGARKSPKTAILGLAADGFFAQRRSIGTVVTHLREKKATTLSQQAVQMALNRLVQNGEMERGKNGESQFEYWK